MGMHRLAGVLAAVRHGGPTHGGTVQGLGLPSPAWELARARGDLSCVTCVACVAFHARSLIRRSTPEGTPLKRALAVTLALIAGTLALGTGTASATDFGAIPAPTTVCGGSVTFTGIPQGAVVVTTPKLRQVRGFQKPGTETFQGKPGRYTFLIESTITGEVDLHTGGSGSFTIKGCVSPNVPTTGGA